MDKNPSKQQLSIHFIDVGQGESIFIQFPSNVNMLVDTGFPEAAGTVIKLLQSLQVKQINHLILTHPHDDHIGGIFAIHDQFKVDAVYDNGTTHLSVSEFPQQYVDLIRGEKSNYRILAAGDQFTFSHSTVTVLSPHPPLKGDTNGESLVLRIAFRDVSVLLTGDIHQTTEKRLLQNKVILKSNILKVAHHGNKDASSNEFLRQVRPEITIISVGRGNQWGVPHQEILHRFEMLNTTIYRTDLHGTITLQTDGQKFWVNTK